jgi:predicted nucleic-acid-binding Zn-ribbon protein
VTPGQRCPKCGGSQFLIVDPVRDADCDAVTSTHDMHVLACATSGVLRTGRYRLEICEACGFTEWFATHLDPGVVATMLADPAAGVRRVRS